MKTEYRYIGFDDISPKARRTRLYLCKNRRHNAALGIVQWNAPWRQYVFEPNECCIFSADCLADIQDFIGQLMAERKS